MPPKDAAFEIAALPFFLSEHRLSSALFGSANIRRDFPAFVRLAEQGQLDLAGFVSRTMPLDQVNAGLDMLERGEVLRAVLLPGTQQ
jgi:S-(hydroxymethyl)glutathione dehydrogenase/alcohol dehydrogenase